MWYTHKLTLYYTSPPCEKCTSGSTGVLVSAVLLRMLVNLENKGDHSEEASHRLMVLCKMLHDVEDLFTDDVDEVTGHLNICT